MNPVVGFSPLLLKSVGIINCLFTHILHKKKKKKSELKKAITGERTAKVPSENNGSLSVHLDLYPELLNVRRAIMYTLLTLDAHEKFYCPFHLAY